MVRIRLRRMGSKKQAYYRIVVADKESPRDGKFIETIGTYNPRTEPETVKVAEDRALYWMKVGAKPSESVTMLFKKAGTLGRFDRLMKGEAPDVLLKEAESVYVDAAKISPKTRIGRTAKPNAKKAKKAAAAA